MYDVGWQGSSAWIADQIRRNISASMHALLTSPVRHQAPLRPPNRRSLTFNPTHRRRMIAGVFNPTLEGTGLNKAWQQTTTWLQGSGPVPVAVALEAHGHRWSELWTESENFGLWRASHRGASLANALLAGGGVAKRRAGTGPDPPRAGVGAFTYESGDTYTGSWRNGRRHGVGVYEERATGNSYEGDWVDDARHGRGVLTSGAKDFMYDGDWVHDKRTGNGKSVIRGTETYSGGWKDGEFHGTGVHCDARGNVYDGEFAHGQRQGVGRWKSKAGLEYVGEWRAGHMSGVGQSTDIDGTTYSGEWHEDRYAGEGTLTLPSGARYEGMFREGEKHGPGSLLTAEGDTLEGEWIKSKPQEGDTEWRIRFANGDHYAGTVLDGAPHGAGTYKYSNGDIFTGGWDRGLRHGQGICVFANGEKFEGEWLRDHISYQGKGALTLADGTTHDFA
ncbi:unnamed protein product [Scytosiphon promiscuus]